MMVYIASYNPNAEVEIFENKISLIKNFSEFFARKITESQTMGRDMHIALSGGSTPDEIYKYLSDHKELLADLSKTHLYWGDERCVSPDNSESNFASAKKLFLSNFTIPEANIHRIKGENDPFVEANRYVNELKLIPVENSIPVFDLVILGMGDDGHTASIFPDRMELLKSNNLTSVAVHPKSGQKRITLSGTVINNAREVCFLVTGQNKSAVIKEIFTGQCTAIEFPAYHIKPENGKLYWFLDQEAASNL